MLRINATAGVPHRETGCTSRYSLFTFSALLAPLERCVYNCNGSPPSLLHTHSSVAERKTGFADVDPRVP